MKTDNQHKTEIVNPVVHSKIEGMPLFKYSCGFSILIVPDLSEMDKAIRAHIVDHKRITGQRLKEETIVHLILKTVIEYKS